MKKIVNIFLSLAILVAFSSCEEEKLVDDTLDNTVAGGVLRSLEENNDLDFEDLSSTYTHLLEAQDEEGGELLEEVIVLVGLTDDDEEDTDDDGEIDDFANSVDQSEFARIPASEFSLANSTSINGLPAATFSTTLGDLLAGVGLSIDDVDPGDVFNISFQMVLTDGRIFDASNATSDITRTGRFSFFNAQFDYNPSIGDPQRVTLDVTGVGPDGNAVLTSGQTDTVLLAFDRATFSISNPTVTATLQSAGTNVTAATSALAEWPADLADLLEDTPFEDEDNVFFFTYTAPAVAQDTVMFVISGAADAMGRENDVLTMASEDFEDAFVIDNTPPVASQATTNINVVGTGAGTIDEIILDVSFSEAVDGDITYTITSAQFDTITITQEAEASLLEQITLEPEVSGAGIPSGTDITFTVVATGDGVDVAGNDINSTFTVSLF